jgi:murein L,D-transpeptidase YafK
VITKFSLRRFVFGIAVAFAAAITTLLAWANWPGDSLASGTVADRVVVWKAKRTLELYANGKLLKSYAVSLGRNPVGPKLQDGDKRTPEGLYAVELHKLQSSFHKALKVSYPSAADRSAAAKRGVTPGGDIMIHGIHNGLGFIGRLQRWRDWTAGCIAVTDPEIDEIYRAVPDGTPVEIHP